MEEAAQAERVVVMDHGEIVMDAPPREVFSNVEKLKELGLDVPQSTELCYLLKKAGFDISADTLTVCDCVEKIWDLYQKGGAKND